MFKFGRLPLALTIIIASLNAACTLTRGFGSNQTDELKTSTYWQENTDTLVSSINSGADAGKRLESQLPTLTKSVKKDAENAAMLAFWGTSINFDEAAKAEIVNAQIIAAIGQLAGKPMNGRYVHAGLIHTYGYLLSNLMTPYGYKRERWTNPTIDDGLGWSTSTISPTPVSGTLLTNVTALAGKIAFRDDARRLNQLNAATTGAAPEIRALDINKLKIRRLTETVSWPDEKDTRAKLREVTLYTDLVKLPLAATGSKSLTHILVYSITDSDGEGRKLITVFPMTDAAADAVFTPANLGPDKTVVTRYNAYVPGLTGSAKMGRRIVSP